jgi:peptidoglycan glycosyltransferase
MPIQRELRQLAAALLIAFAGVALAAAYWAVVGPNTLSTRDDNPRRVEQETRLQRGSILDRAGTTLATSLADADGHYFRSYPYPETNGALGYFSYRYGTSGVEAAYDSLLRGDDQRLDVFSRLLADVAHIHQRGSDIRLTLDITVQRTALDELGDRRGAVIVMDAAVGQVLALISQPAYDPNTLDASWETLTQQPGNPFFNRALQGRYQPGGALQPVLVAAALLSNTPVDIPIQNAAQPVQMGQVTYRCLSQPPDTTLTLADALRYGCPYPFVTKTASLGIDPLRSIIESFGLAAPQTLSGFVTGDEPIAPAFTLTANNRIEHILGQSDLAVSPLQMASVAAAILNGGSAPSPYLLLQFRRPDSAHWIDVPPPTGSRAFTTSAVAQQLQTIMQQSAILNEVNTAAEAGFRIGGHAALAYSGTTSQTWFFGFIPTGPQQGFAIALILEDTADPAAAARIAARILLAAAANR